MGLPGKRQWEIEVPAPDEVPVWPGMPAEPGVPVEEPVEPAEAPVEVPA